MKLNSKWFAKAPPGYCSVGEHMRLCFDEVHQTLYNNTNFTPLMESLPDSTRELHVKQMANIQFWQRTNGVTVFPSTDLVQKCVNTEVMDSIVCDDIRVSFPTVLFTLPKSTAFQVPATHLPDREAGTDYSIGHLLVSVYDSNTELSAVIDKVNTYRLKMPPGSRHMLITAFWNKHFVNSFSIPLGNMSVRETLDSTRDSFIGDELRMFAMDDKQVESEKTETRMISEWACPLVVNFLLLMQSYPEILTLMDDGHQRPHVYRNSPKPATYAIGDVRNLMPRPIVVGKQSADGGESHASPHAHWRRGHWRRQPHTAHWYQSMVNEQKAPKEIDLPDGRKAHMVWIEPVFVGIKPGKESKTITQL